MGEIGKTKSLGLSIDSVYGRELCQIFLQSCVFGCGNRPVASVGAVVAACWWLSGRSRHKNLVSKKSAGLPSEAGIHPHNFTEISTNPCDFLDQICR